MIRAWMNPADGSATDAGAQTKTGTVQTEAADGSPAAEDENPDLSQLPPEAETEAAGDNNQTKPDDEEAEADPSTEADPAKRGLVKRVQKLQQLKRQLRGEVAQKDTELEGLRSKVTTLERELQSRNQLMRGEPQSQRDPMADIRDVASVDAKAAQASEIVDWVDERLENVADDPDSVAQELEGYGRKAPEGGWTPEAMRAELRQIKAGAKGVLKAAPARKAWLQTEDHALNQVAALEPELENPESPVRVEFDRILQSRPWLKLVPDWPLMALAGAIGLQQLAQRQAKPQGAATAKAGQPQPQVRKAPKIPGAPKSAPSGAKSDGLEELRRRATAPGATGEDRRRYIAAQLRESAK